MVSSLQVIREEEQQHQRDPGEREKENVQETRHEGPPPSYSTGSSELDLWPVHRTLLLRATQRTCQQSGLRGMQNSHGQLLAPCNIQRCTLSKMAGFPTIRSPWTGRFGRDPVPGRPLSLLREFWAYTPRRKGHDQPQGKA